MGHIYKYCGSPEQAKKLWENKEALQLYLSRLKELMEADEGDESPKPPDAMRVEACIDKTQMP